MAPLFYFRQTIAAFSSFVDGFAKVSEHAVRSKGKSYSCVSVCVCDVTANVRV